jgi:hypothetical protein
MQKLNGSRSAIVHMKLVKSLVSMFGRSRGWQDGNSRAGCRNILRLEALECRTVPSILWDNGPFVTGMGNGFGGADTSAVEMGALNFGYTVGENTFHIADDFTVSDEQGWAVSSLSIYAYQTGSSTNSTFTGIFLTLWDGPPGRYGSVLIARSGNLFSSSAWTGAYRVPLTDPQLHDRPIMYITADVSKWEEFPTPLPAGSYWVEWGLTGDATLAGPFAVPTTPLGIADNARQYNVSTDRWSGVYDFGLGETRDFPFQVEGEVAGNRTRGARLAEKAALGTSALHDECFFRTDVGIAELTRVSTASSGDADDVSRVVDHPKSALATGGLDRTFTGNAVPEPHQGVSYTSLPNDTWPTGICVDCLSKFQPD